MINRFIYAIYAIYIIYVMWLYDDLDKSNRLQMFFKMSVLKNFLIFSGKHLYWNLSNLFFQVAGLKNLQSTWSTPTQAFPVCIVKFLRKAFFTERLW